MGNLIDLKRHKEYLLDKKISLDINEILKVLYLTKKALSFLDYYKPIKLLLGNLEANIKLFEMHRDKYENSKQPKN